MKKTILIIIHLLLWIMVFFTFFNIHNALEGFPKPQGYSPYSDPDLYTGAFSTTLCLVVPFYFGYLVLQHIFFSKKRSKWLLSTLVFIIFYPVLISILDDGFRESFITQSAFLIAFLNLFLILGAGFKALVMLIENNNSRG
ncbi:hypothetical protein [Marinilabilia rubra]|uniref:Uncharacterized protein n=1 Tax=Marinilabilia rubra TaxID=2162893 RepID=A0A2U2B9B5_9BACT|nr:hypothetical protein [Marinilabilia rubra]PWD99647.1 hypothetical protein DDZ16_09380 [Marinilabilia rubra]